MEPLQGCDESGPGLGWILYMCVYKQAWGLSVRSYLPLAWSVQVLID